MFFRRELLLKINGYDESFKTAQDYELYSRFYQHGKMENVPEVLLTHRFPSEIFVGEKLRLQDINGIRIRWRLIRERVVPWYYAAYLMKPLIAICLPVDFREWVRRIRQGR